MPLPRKTNLGIGIVGFGGFARRAHLPDYQAVGWPVVGIASRNPEARRLARDEFGIEHTFSDYRDLINHPQVAVLDLVTQPELREEVVIAAAVAKKPIIVEKPLAGSTEECRRMIEIADQAKIPLAVHQNYRWMKGNFLAQQIVSAGWIGRPFFVGIEIFGKQDHTLASHPFYSKCDNYLTLHWNTHLVDLIRFWTGKNARRVSAHTVRVAGQNFQSDNLFFSIHDFGRELTGHIVHSELVQSSNGSNRCRIDGSKGSLLFDFAAEQLTIDSQLLDRGALRLSATNMNWPHALCGSMGDFLIAIEEGREPLVSGRRNLPTIQTVMAEIESARKDGQWIDTGCAE
jgi:predicted dehydrogenase